MQLVCKSMYSFYRKQGLLAIEPCAEDLFGPTYYCFRLGGVMSAGKVVAVKNEVPISPREGLHVFSRERFVLSKRVFGLLGASSELILGGLHLKHSPFIDPGFAGSLELVIENWTASDLTLKPEMILGKVTFFDVSDTMLELHEHALSERTKEKWQARDEAWRNIQDAIIEARVNSEAPNPNPIRWS